MSPHHDALDVAVPVEQQPGLGSGVQRLRMADGSLAWLVGGYNDCRRWLRSGLLALDDVHAGSGYRGFRLPGSLAADLQNRDGEDHARLRALAAQPLAPRHVARWEGHIGRVADQLAASLVLRGGGELMGDFALPLVLTVVCDLLDIPVADRRDLAGWTRTMFRPDRSGGLDSAVEHVRRLMARLVADRRRTPGDDLITWWGTTGSEHARADEDELVLLAFGMWWAGIENTAHLICLSALHLIRQPGTLRDHPRQAPAVVEELLRRHGPALTSARRFARRDVTIGGRHIPAGDTVLFALAAANHDPDQFPHPYRFLPDRPSGHHLAFGHGPHYCPGAALARAELRATLGALHHLPRLALAVPENALNWRRSPRLKGLLTLPVTV
ncbi:cytochrome P450 [Streptomyces albireticuli]|uniref:Cytochrome P450 n=1 Tax=Streptomyces albireticuli TaxID=1940 RepID=A0A2A2D6F9_9ACTN|nr:cytochrome P450 [Streptomyces albireticuli]MCD9146026.1 cytochrome P450 [Streptomyces albireticuli]MCD9165787.1 cytochrome P450 [Streptomyces albireticuli]MCD9196005.1 cytochrome P450 [Streptomyces albireticuli]PAU46902.1 cytochrome P450 [Streptomyces albireticuli]